MDEGGWEVVNGLVERVAKGEVGEGLWEVSEGAVEAVGEGEVGEGLREVVDRVALVHSLFW